MEYLFAFCPFRRFCHFLQAMSAADLGALSDDQLRARYQNVIGSPAPRGPAVTRDLLVRAILAKKGSPAAASTPRASTAPAHTATPPAAKKPTPAPSKQVARVQPPATGFQYADDDDDEVVAAIDDELEEEPPRRKQAQKAAVTSAPKRRAMEAAPAAMEGAVTRLVVVVDDDAFIYSSATARNSLRPRRYG